jgi:hypothetical protein
MSETLTRWRFQTAIILAVAADALQIFVFPFFAEGALSPADDVLDLAVAAILVRLLDWHYEFLPAFAGELVPKYDLRQEYFGEGLTDWNSSLVQLTWKAGTAFVYDRFSFAIRHTFHYEGEGWGLTQDSTALIMSDGSSVLRILDPKSFRESRRIPVRDGDSRPVEQLNELEYIHGEIYANIWHANKIARISPRTGKVLGWIDLSGLMDMSQLPDADAVLNGIAYDTKDDRLFVTGKLWPSFGTKAHPHLAPFSCL